eukprot:scaffold227098_cov18-Prasinocladus_malaysianus.AAC.3
MHMRLSNATTCWASLITSPPPPRAFLAAKCRPCGLETAMAICNAPEEPDSKEPRLGSSVHAHSQNVFQNISFAIIAMLRMPGCLADTTACCMSSEIALAQTIAS